MAPSKPTLVKGDTTIRQDVCERLDVPAKWAAIINSLAPSLEVIKRRQSVYSGIDGKFKNPLGDVPQEALPSNTFLFFHN